MGFTQLNQLKSLRDISRALDEENLAELLDLISISAAQISRKLRSDLLGTTQELFAGIIHQAGINQGFQRVRQELGQLYLIDSTGISLCFSQYRWADFRKTKSSIKLHTRIRLLDGIILPNKAVISVARKADRTQMKNALRITKATDNKGKIITIVANDFSLSAQQIADIYRYRWQVELFFKWIKQHLQVKLSIFSVPVNKQ